MSEHSLVRRLLESEWLLGITQAAGVLSGFLVTTLLVRLLGPSEFGQYAIATMMVVLLSIPLGRGWSTLVLRTVSKIGDSMRWRKSVSLMKSGRRLSTFYGLCVLVCSVAGIRLLGLGLPIIVLLTLSFLLIVRQNSTFRYALMRGAGFPVPGQLASMVIQPVVFAGFLVTMLITHRDQLTWIDLVPFLLISHISSLLFATICQRFLLAINLNIDRALVTKKRLNSWFCAAGLIGANAFIVTLLGQFDTYALAFFSDSSEVGQYRLAIQCAALGGFIYALLNYLAAAKMSAHWSQGNRTSIENVSRRYGSWSLAFVVSCLLVVVWIGDSLVTLFFGKDFLPAIPLILILLAGQAINSIFGLPAVLLTMTGKDKRVLSNSILALFVNVIASFLLIPIVGAYGAASASVLAVLYLNLSHYSAARKHLQVDTAIWGRRR